MNFDGRILKLVYEFNGYGIVLYVLITSTLSAILAFLLGLERQLRGKNISLKTHILLAVGCSLLMTVSIWAVRIADGSLNITSGTTNSVNQLSYDTSRIAAAVVTGMGFLGAGAIIKDKISVRGLSTAATLWISAAIGLATGSGFILEAIIFTILVVLILLIINQTNKFLSKKALKIIIKAKNDVRIVKKVSDIATENDVVLKNIYIAEVADEYTTAVVQLPLNINKPTVQYLKNQLDKEEQLEVVNK